PNALAESASHAAIASRPVLEITPSIPAAYPALRPASRIGYDGGMARFRLPLRFSLRTLFVVVTAMGAGLEWLVSEWRVIQQRNEIATWIDERNKEELPGSCYLGVHYFGRESVPWFRWMLGDQ